MSAASFLGIAGLVALRGYDGMIYATGWLVGWPALMFLIAEPLRNLGKYTFADVVAFRLRQVPVRIAAAFGGILTLLFYVLAQMVGAGNLITLMFGICYECGGRDRRRRDAAVRAVRRDDRDDLGPDHQGDPAAVRGDAAGRCWCWRSFHFSPGELYAAVADALRPGGARARRAGHRSRSTRCRSALR